MGHVRNHAIVIESWDRELLLKAHYMAQTLFGAFVTEITPAGVNGTHSFGAFIVPPDGSKEGWQESKDGDARRQQLKDWLRKQAFDDGSSPLDWVEMRFGGDDREAVIEDDGHRRQEPPTRRLRLNL
jgi:hypothetical protein